MFCMWAASIRVPELTVSQGDSADGESRRQDAAAQGVSRHRLVLRGFVIMAGVGIKSGACIRPGAPGPPCALPYPLAARRRAARPAVCGAGRRRGGCARRAPLAAVFGFVAFRVVRGARHAVRRHRRLPHRRGGPDGGDHLQHRWVGVARGWVTLLSRRVGADGAPIDSGPTRCFSASASSCLLSPRPATCSQPRRRRKCSAAAHAKVLAREAEFRCARIDHTSSSTASARSALDGRSRVGAPDVCAARRFSQGQPCARRRGSDSPRAALAHRPFPGHERVRWAIACVAHHRRRRIVGARAAADPPADRRERGDARRGARPSGGRSRSARRAMRPRAHRRREPVRSRAARGRGARA